MYFINYPKFKIRLCNVFWTVKWTYFNKKFSSSLNNTFPTTFVCSFLFQFFLISSRSVEDLAHHLWLVFNSISVIGLFETRNERYNHGLKKN